MRYQVLPPDKLSEQLYPNVVRSYGSPAHNQDLSFDLLCVQRNGEIRMSEKIIFELSGSGKRGFTLPKSDLPTRFPEELLPPEVLRGYPPELPEVSEVEAVRHFVNLSTLNYHIDKGPYPLGSCTMKYNPKIGERLAALPGFCHLHPYQPESTVQGALKLMYELEGMLCQITGMDRMTLQPAAGAQGELTGLLMVRAYHLNKGNPRKKVIIPDSAHGTNPASTHLAGYQAVEVKSNPQGLVDLAQLKELVDEDVAALMLTNPNTLGLFESQIVEIAEIVHRAGALLYMDGANMNALLGISRPGDMGFDLVHLNLHKTFSAPHGGGGPGSGPVGVRESLADFLPLPTIEKGEKGYRFNYDRPSSIGKVQGFYGNFGVMVKAYIYLRMLGAKGLREVSEGAITNANYLMKNLKAYYHLPYDRFPLHEFVLSGSRQKAKGVRTLDIAKRLLDYGFHPPTVYFPLIVPEALMIEPTETEPKEALDGFIAAMKMIAQESEEDPDLVRSAPHTTPVSRLDERRAAKDLDVRWKGR